MLSNQPSLDNTMLFLKTKSSSKVTLQSKTCDKPTQTEIRFKNYPYNYQQHSSQYTTLIVVLTSDALLAEDIYDKWIRYKTHDKYPCVYPLSNQLHLLFH